MIFEIRVQSPRWAQWDRIEIYSNTGGHVSSVVVAPATPYLYTATPLQTLVEGDWFVAVVKGSDGACGPMFPIYPHNLTTAGNTTLANLVDGNVGQSGTMALGYTNALYVGP